MYICIITLFFRFTRRLIESLGGFVSYIGCLYIYVYLYNKYIYIYIYIYTYMCICIYV